MASPLGSLNAQLTFAKVNIGPFQADHLATP
jgi:hypothetical protein